MATASRVLRQEAQHKTPATGELYLKPMGKDFNMNKVRKGDRPASNLSFVLQVFYKGKEA